MPGSKERKAELGRGDVELETDPTKDLASRMGAGGWAGLPWLSHPKAGHDHRQWVSSAKAIPKEIYLLDVLSEPWGGGGVKP